MIFRRCTRPERNPASRDYPATILKAAFLLSGVVLLGWATLMLAVEPASDPHAAVDYLFFSFTAAVLLAAIWLAVFVGWLTRRLIRRTRRVANPS